MDNRRRLVEHCASFLGTGAPSFSRDIGPPRSLRNVMSWDVFVFNAPDGARSVEQMPHDFAPPALGSLADVTARLQDAFPALALTDPGWGHLTGPTWTIEFSVGTDDPAYSVMLLVRGTGDDVLPVVLRVASVLGSRALDVTTGEFLTGDGGQVAGWHSFQKYRDHVLDG
jgi:hypothetical protein